MSTPRKLFPAFFSKLEIKTMRSKAEPRLYSRHLVLKATYDDKQVVIKRSRLKKHPENDEERANNEIAKRDFDHEKAILILANNQVPNIVDFLGAGVYATKHHICLYLVTAYEPNGDLFHFIDKNKILEWGTRLSIMNGATSGIAYLHERGYAHDDIKSLNVLLDSDYQVKLCDFESSERVGLIGSGSGATFAWRAPELFDDCEDKSLAADVYSLAVVFWEIASWAHVNSHYVNLLLVCNTLGIVPDADILKWRDAIPDDCPPRIAHLISWGWQTDPEKRPTIQQVTEELKSIKFA